MLTGASQSDGVTYSRLQVMIRLYHKNVWNDNKTVNVISTGLFSEVTKIKVRPLPPLSRPFTTTPLAPCCCFQALACTRLVVRA